MAKSKLIQAAAITFAVFLAGCATNQTEETAGGTETEQPEEQEQAQEEEEDIGELDLEVEQQPEVEMEDEMAEEEPALSPEVQALLDETIIYFSFDKSNVRTEFRTILNAHAENLVANPDMSVVLEGHADERGTREYNLALGERRSSSVQDYLMLKGVSAGQIDVVSYGEERPIALGSTKEDYRQNRRVEIKYQ